MTELDFTCRVARTLYDYSDKKYMNLLLDAETASQVIRVQFSRVDINPLIENVLKVKVPFRYRKIDFPVRGDKTLYELEEGDEVRVKIKCCGIWKVEDLSGYAWKFVLLECHKHGGG
jgi:uncharacterized protein YlaN (UPF0358 family)